MTMGFDTSRTTSSAGTARRRELEVREQHLEAHHRIANSLQLISSLLSSEGREILDPRAKVALELSVHRIAAVAGVHRQLYLGNEAGWVDIATYFLDLVDGLQAGFCATGGARRLHLQVDDRLVSPGFATTLGIMATELIINACKHAYGEVEHGDIDILVEFSPAGRFSLAVRDQGLGRGAPAQADGLGSRLLELMAGRLNASGGYMTVDRGTCYRITGPLPPR